MAKKSKIARQAQREVLVERYAARRSALAAEVSAVGTSPQRRQEAVRELSRLPRNSSRTRLRNRDQSDGRPRGYLRKFGLSRISFRDMAHRGELPGVTKSSW